MAEEARRNPLKELLDKREIEKNKAQENLLELREIKGKLAQISEKLDGNKKTCHFPSLPRLRSPESEAIVLHFAIKQANDNPRIENEVIEYVKKKVDAKKYNIITTFDWKARPGKMPLIVFCNYSSRIGVDIDYSLRGVKDPEVIVIVMHLSRKDLMRGDLSDTDYLLSNDLRQRVAYIGHFAFDENVYECEQNSQQRDKLCTELKKILGPSQ